MGAKHNHVSHNTHRLCSSIFNTLLFEAMAELLFDDSIICDLIRKINHTGEEVEHVLQLTHMEVTASSVHKSASQER